METGQGAKAAEVVVVLPHQRDGAQIQQALVSDRHRGRFHLREHAADSLDWILEHEPPGTAMAAKLAAGYNEPTSRSTPSSNVHTFRSDYRFWPTHWAWLVALVTGLVGRVKPERTELTVRGAQQLA